jgi:prophage DNA circulation protein
VTLRSTVVRDLTQRARPLPAMVTFNLGPRLPALVIAQRLYADASREGELIQENAVVHPLFMLGSGQALAS